MGWAFGDKGFGWKIWGGEFGVEVLGWSIWVEVLGWRIWDGDGDSSDGIYVPYVMEFVAVVSGVEVLGIVICFPSKGGCLSVLSSHCVLRRFVVGYWNESGLLNFMMKFYCSINEQQENDWSSDELDSCTRTSENHVDS